MIESNYLISIVIPTKDRYRYLRNLVDSILDIVSKQIEIVIQDNSDNNSEFLLDMQKEKYSQINYLHTSGWLSMSENCELAVSRANGEYICMIGDDDGVSPLVVVLANWMKENSIHAALTSKPIYHWPGMQTRLGGINKRGTLFVPAFKGTVTIVNVANELSFVLGTGATQMRRLPRVYHGLVSRSKLDELREMAGTCFPGPSPDMANAVGLCAVIETLAFVDMPIVITGNCSESGAGQGARGAHHGELKDKAFLPRDVVDKWPKYIPLFWSGPTIWAVSAVEALKETRQQDKLEHLDLAKLYASCLIFHWNYSERVNYAITFSHMNTLTGRVLILRAKLWVWSLRVISLFKNIRLKLSGKSNGTLKIEDLPNISSAINFMSMNFNYPDKLERMER